MSLSQPVLMTVGNEVTVHPPVCSWGEQWFHPIGLSAPLCSVRYHLDVVGLSSQMRVSLHLQLCFFTRCVKVKLLTFGSEKGRVARIVAVRLSIVLEKNNTEMSWSLYFPPIHFPWPLIQPRVTVLITYYGQIYLKHGPFSKVNILIDILRQWVCSRENEETDDHHLFLHLHGEWHKATTTTDATLSHSLSEDLLCGPNPPPTSECEPADRVLLHFSHFRHGLCQSFPREVTLSAEGLWGSGHVSKREKDRGFEHKPHHHERHMHSPTLIHRLRPSHSAWWSTGSLRSQNQAFLF